MSEFIGHNSRVKTEILKEFDTDKKYRITVEKILEGGHKNEYVIRSYVKSIFGYKIASLAAWNLNSDDGSFEFKPFRMLKQALDFTKDVKKNRFSNWVKHQ